MEKRKFNPSIIKNIIVLAIWGMLLFLNLSIIVLQMLGNVDNSNMYQYIGAIALVIGIYSIGIGLNIRNLIFELKNKVSVKKNILSYLFQVAFAFCAFVSLFEAGLDSKTTTEQVRAVISFLQGDAININMQEFDIVIEDQKEDYEIGDEIPFEIDCKPFYATRKELTYELDNNIVSIDLVNNKIKCLANGECTITFRDATTKKLTSTVKVKIDTLLVNKIDLGDKKDIFLKPNEQYKLEPLIYPEVFQNKKVTYSSSNSKVATVDQNGLITAYASGNTVISCSCDGVTEQVYVCVNPILDFKLSADKFTFISDYVGYKSFTITFDTIESFTSKYVKLDYKSEHNIKIQISSFYPSTNSLSFTITNNDEQKKIDEIIPLTISYVYPGGYTISKSMEIIVTSGDDILVSEINTTKTKLTYDINIYYDELGYLVTQFYEFPIYYSKSLTNKNLSISKATCFNEDIDLSLTRYNKVIIDFKDLESIQDQYFIKFYPSSNVDEYIEIAVRTNKVLLNSTDSSFEMTRLYEQSENINEIWPSYFTLSLFELYTFNDPQFKYSGIKIIPIGDTLDYIDFEVTNFGIVENLTLKSLTKLNYAKECTLEFDICSLYEYNKDRDCQKYRYVINIVNEYDDLHIKLNGTDLHTEDCEINVLKGETIKIAYIPIVNLIHKGNFQTSFYRSSNVAGVCSDSSVITFGNGYFIAKEYGIAKLTLSFNKAFLKNTHPVVFTINVIDENGNIPVPKKIDISLIEQSDVCAPNLSKGTVTVGTTFSLSVLDISKYTFKSSNTDVLVISEDNVAKCIGTGKVTITAINNDNPSEVYHYSLTVYEETPKLEIVQGDFGNIQFKNKYYYLVAKTNEAYQIKLSEEFEFVTFHETKEYENLRISEDGVVVVTKAGSYYCHCFVGEEGSPYRYRINFIITCDDNGVTAQILMFIRKSFGHFGLFFIISMLGALAAVLYRPRKYGFLIINGICLYAYSFVIAYATEFIQGLNPTRTNSFKDVMIDFSGSATAITSIFIIFFIILGLIKLISKFKKKKKDITK